MDQQCPPHTRDDEKLFSIINDSFQQKIDAEVQVPTDPHYQDMNAQFLSIINNPDCAEEPFNVWTPKHVRAHTQYAYFRICLISRSQTA